MCSQILLKDKECKCWTWAFWKKPSQGWPPERRGRHRRKTGAVLCDDDGAACLARASGDVGLPHGSVLERSSSWQKGGGGIPELSGIKISRDQVSEAKLHPSQLSEFFYTLSSSPSRICCLAFCGFNYLWLTAVQKY